MAPTSSVDAPGGPERPFHFLVSTTACVGDLARHMGSADYSYAFVLKALAPVLDDLGGWSMVPNPESSLAYRAEQVVARGERPIHLAIHPPQNVYLTPAVPTVIFPFWEFPEVPDRDFGHDGRQNWLRMCGPVDLILSACQFTARNLRKAGIGHPVAVVPVPLPTSPFDVPKWDPDRSWTLDCRHFSWGGAKVETASADESSIPPPPRARGLKGHYHRYVRPHLSPKAIHAISKARRKFIKLPPPELPLLPRSPLTLSGLVFTSIFNLGDRRKNPEDMLTAFLLAFQDREDVTLVLKLATSPSREFHEVNEIRALYGRLGLEHRCRVVVVTDYLSDSQMDELMRSTTFYVNTSRAEGACLPLQQALASGRPAIAPSHSAMLDFMDESLGLVVDSHPEPTFWPHDPEHRYETTWHRLVWSDLRDRFLQAARIAEADRDRFDAMSSAARRRMSDYASREVVRDELRKALRHLRQTRVGRTSWAA